jgi:hypothetical protein
MKKKTAVLAIFLLFLTATFAATASTLKCGGSCGCGGGGGTGGGGTDPTPDCDDPYSVTYDATISDPVSILIGKDQFFGFDPVQSPGDGFEITEVLLTITTNSDGLFFDSVLAVTGAGLLDWEFVGFLTGGTQVFSLDESLFDLVLNGIEFKAWFSGCGEAIISALLTINGVYCDPSQPNIPTPLPGAVWLFGSALAGFIGLSRRRKLQA